MKKLTLDQARESLAEGHPLFKVTFLPYIDGADPDTGAAFDGRHGHIEELFGCRCDARRRFDQLREAVAHVEYVELHEMLDYRQGLSGWRLLDTTKEAATQEPTP